MKDLYETLGVSPEAHSRAIRKAYQRLAFQCHPDRLPADAKAESRCQFQEVEEAWRILGDPEARRKYDSQRAEKSKRRAFVAEVVRLSSMKYEDEERCYTWSCRCGDLYVLERDETENDKSEIVSCSGCSLNIEVLLKDE
ncbi:dnaJ homolog subfamily C member 24-like isoform X2 [Oscarella lobularis]|uniref:dnaJ homolog subfamily C member 24-like isoform X2 n=1 Tax=Oscarella lobularis TaxID=121494 RepID=UPI0033138BF4